MSRAQGPPTGGPGSKDPKPRGGTGTDARERTGWASGMFSCPRCRRQFHRSFLERFWSEWQVVCWVPDGRSYHLDCPLLSAPPPADALDAPEESPSPPRSSGDPPGATQVLGACLGDCALCGDHARLAVVTSGGVLSRCLRCRDEKGLDAPPPFCARAGAISHRAARRPPTTGAERG